VLGAAVVAELKSEPLSAVGTSRTRPPYHPLSLAAIAGHRAGQQLRVCRRTPLHGWHATHGGVLEPAEYWMRTRYYRTNGSDASAAGIAEAARVRKHGGIVDGSTLGKIEVAGRDAARYLDRMYLSKASTIKVGRGKYMVNLREDGMVLDDGIVLRLATDRFLATTSSGHAEHVLSHFEHYRDLEFDGAEVALANVTEVWAVIVAAGPPAARCCARAGRRLGRATRPAVAHGLRRRHPRRQRAAGAARELLGRAGLRAALPAGTGLALWQSLLEAGLAPYGLEALDILRVEKGYLVGAELNGQTTPGDLGMENLVGLGNPCIGRALLDRPAFREAARPKLVGLRAADGRSVILGGAQITHAGAPARSLGYITSSAYSPALGEWIALALVARCAAGDGASLLARDPLRGGDVPVRVTAPVHFDAAAERMKS